MKKLILILCIAFYGDLAVCPLNNVITIATKPPISPYQALWEATTFIESSNNPNALNRLENAVGIAQIRPIRLKDYNQRTGKGYSLRQMYDPIISKEIWLFYATTFHPSQSEQIAKAWNGKGKSNKVYWRAVKKQMENNLK